MGAYDHVRVLSVDIGPRPTGSETCRQGAEYIQSALHQIGIQTKVQVFKLRPNFWTGTALLGVLFSISICATFYSYSLLSLGLSVLYPLLVVLEIDRGKDIALRLFPSAIGRNVMGIQEPIASPIHRILICAHHDSKTQAIPIHLRRIVIVFLFISMLFMMFGSMLHIVILYFLPDYSLIENLIYIGMLFAVLYHLLYIFVNLLTRFIEQSPGAEDNAAGVGLALELARKVKSDPLWKTEMWFLFTDGEEIAMKGAHAFLQEFQKEVDGAMVFNLEGGGTEEPITYSIKEKSILKAKSSEKLAKIIKDVAEKTTGIAEPMSDTTTTDGYVFAKNGFEAITIWRYKEEVRDVAHTSRDTIDRLDSEILDNTVDFLEELVRHIDST